MLGTDIKELRARKGWSQGQLAAHLGVTQATVSRLENGEWQVTKSVAKLLDLLRDDEARRSA